MFRFLKSSFNIKVIIGAILFAVCIFAILLWMLWSAKAKSPSQSAPTAILNIIVAPTRTSLVPTATVTPTGAPTTSPGVPTPSGDVAVGDYVQVKGTGGDGLRLHSSAGVSSSVRYVAIEAEVFLVKSGPNEADGYKWWLLEDPYTKNEVGWGVANYLTIVQNP